MSAGTQRPAASEQEMNALCILPQQYFIGKCFSANFAVSTKTFSLIKGILLAFYRHKMSDLSLIRENQDSGLEKLYVFILIFAVGPQQEKYRLFFLQKGCSLGPPIKKTKAHNILL